MLIVSRGLVNDTKRDININNFLMSYQDIELRFHENTMWLILYISTIASLIRKTKNVKMKYDSCFIKDWWNSFHSFDNEWHWHTNPILFPPIQLSFIYYLSSTMMYIDKNAMNVFMIYCNFLFLFRKTIYLVFRYI